MQFSNFATLKNNSMFELVLVRLAHMKSRCRAFCVTALKHSPSKRKSITRPLRPLEGDFDSTGKSDAFHFEFRFPVSRKFSALVYRITRDTEIDFRKVADARSRATVPRNLIKQVAMEILHIQPSDRAWATTRKRMIAKTFRSAKSLL